MEQTKCHRRKSADILNIITVKKKRISLKKEKEKREKKEKKEK